MIFAAIKRALARRRERRADPIRAEVRELLDLMGQVDPNGGEQRHPEWPLQIRGDADATGRLCACLNRLQLLTK